MGIPPMPEEVLDRLEDLSLKLEDRFEAVPGQITVVVHPSPIWLTCPTPFLPAVRWAAAPAGRRYLAGWPMATEVHVLGESAMEKRAAGDGIAGSIAPADHRTLRHPVVLAANNLGISPALDPGPVLPGSQLGLAGRRWGPAFLAPGRLLPGA